MTIEEQEYRMFRLNNDGVLQSLYKRLESVYNLSVGGFVYNVRTESIEVNLTPMDKFAINQIQKKIDERIKQILN